MYVLSGMNLGKMRGLSFPSDKDKCPYKVGVRKGGFDCSSNGRKTKNRAAGKNNHCATQLGRQKHENEGVLSDYLTGEAHCECAVH